MSGNGYIWLCLVWEKVEREIEIEGKGERWGGGDCEGYFGRRG